MMFRRADAADDPAIIALWTLCGLTRAWNDPQKDLQFARETATSAVLVYENHGAIVASVMVGHDGHRGMLYYVAVDPQVQRQGLGRAAVNAAESFLRDQGVWKVNLMIRAENTKVQGFYEAMGYEVNPVLCMGRKIITD
jgi:ribosomal protein S18 acetylase RimI-like enzyme